MSPRATAVPMIVLLLGLSGAGGCNRTLLHSDIDTPSFDREVRARWSLGMSRAAVSDAAAKVPLRIRTSEDARTLREIDPAYESGEALAARIVRSGISIDVPYMQAHREVGWLYFIFDPQDHLRLVAYQLSDEQQEKSHQKYRVILPGEATP